jgi:uncharacterized protein YkvS
MNKEKQQQREESIKYLKSILKPGDTVYTVLTHVSKSGMSRDIKCLISTNEAKETGIIERRDTEKGTVEDTFNNTSIVDIGWHVARALDWPLSKKNEWSIKVGGCGMDMGFHLVYTLSSVLFRKEDKSNQADAGYSLNHSWL